MSWFLVFWMLCVISFLQSQTPEANSMDWLNGGKVMLAVAEKLCEYLEQILLQKAQLAVSVVMSLVSVLRWVSEPLFLVFYSEIGGQVDLLLTNNGRLLSGPFPLLSPVVRTRRTMHACSELRAHAQKCTRVLRTSYLQHLKSLPLSPKWSANKTCKVFPASRGRGIEHNDVTFWKKWHIFPSYIR